MIFHSLFRFTLCTILLVLLQCLHVPRYSYTITSFLFRFRWYTWFKHFLQYSSSWIFSFFVIFLPTFCNLKGICRQPYLYHNRFKEHRNSRWRKKTALRRAAESLLYQQSEKAAVLSVKMLTGQLLLQQEVQRILHHFLCVSGIRSDILYMISDWKRYCKGLVWKICEKTHGSSGIVFLCELRYQIKTDAPYFLRSLRNR